MAKKLLYNLALSSLLFLILFFLSAVIFSQVLLKSEAVTVPDLTGKTVAQARAELAKKDLSVLRIQRGPERKPASICALSAGQLSSRNVPCGVWIS